MVISQQADNRLALVNACHMKVEWVSQQLIWKWWRDIARCGSYLWKAQFVCVRIFENREATQWSKYDSNLFLAPSKINSLSLSWRSLSWLNEKSPLLAQSTGNCMGLNVNWCQHRERDLKHSAAVDHSILCFEILSSPDLWCLGSSAEEGSLGEI